jgi:glucokinase
MADCWASVDLGGTNTTVALGDSGGTVLCEKSVPTASHEGPVRILERIAALVNGLASEIAQRPAALGMAAPGLVDRRTGTTLFFPNFPTNWRNVAVRDFLGPAVGCPVHLLNDVRTATLGELAFGHGRAVDCMAFFALGTGIGGGLVIDGRLRLGPLGAAGELGHQTVVADGPRCGCGNRGCLEALASGPAISAEGVRLVRSGQAPALHRLTGGDDSRITPKEMVLAAEAGDEAVRAALVRAFEYIGIGVANVVTCLHPDLVVLGGRLARAGPLLFDTVERVMRTRVGMFPPDNVRIRPSMLGERAGLLGGLALAMRNGNP